jgi:hypothetical protein
MDYFSMSVLTNLSADTSIEAIFSDNASTSLDMPMPSSNSQRRTSRSGLRNSHSWARKRAVMQRGCEWTTTLDRENLASCREHITDYRGSHNMTSLPSSLICTNDQDVQLSTIPPSQNMDSSTSLPSYVSRRRRSSRRLPPIPADSIIHITSSNIDTNVTDDVFHTSTTADYPCQPMRENSLSNRSTRSKSIDSESSIKSRSSHVKLLQTHQTQNAKSIDTSNLARRKSCLVVHDNLIPQRSLDYPYIVRKAQDLSDIVRRRMLYSKISKQQQGDNYSMSLEREHVPKVPRKIIIRQDNSIEIALR